MARTVTIRTLARKLRLSTATVSEALRDRPCVHVHTRERVQRVAEQLGYRHNPLLSAALSAVRRANQRNFRGTLALVDTDETGRGEQVIFHREITAGATARAGSLGFKGELFWLEASEAPQPLRRLQSILSARGIAGIVFLPFPVARDISAFDFSRFAAVQMDHCLLRPQLHTIAPDHYASLRRALEAMRARGYRRIGLCMDQRKDIHLNGKWSAGFHSFSQTHGSDAVPPLISPMLTRETFIPWFRRHRPDLVVGHQQRMVDWLEETGVKVPGSVGFLKLNVTERTGPCAGLDLEPRRLGEIAVETLVAMLHRQERGLPAHAQTTTIEATWIEGPTIRNG